MWPQKAGNAVSVTQNSKKFREKSRTPLQLCRHYGLPLTKILATLLLAITPHFLSTNITSLMPSSIQSVHTKISIYRDITLSDSSLISSHREPRSQYSSRGYVELKRSADDAARIHK